MVDELNYEDARSFHAMADWKVLLLFVIRLGNDPIVVDGDGHLSSYQLPDAATLSPNGSGDQLFPFPFCGGLDLVSHDIVGEVTADVDCQLFPAGRVLVVGGDDGDGVPALCDGLGHLHVLGNFVNGDFQSFQELWPALGVIVGPGTTEVGRHGEFWLGISEDESRGNDRNVCRSG